MKSPIAGVAIACTLLACGEPRAPQQTAPTAQRQRALPEGRASVAFVGDIMTWDRMQTLLETHGAQYPFEATAPLTRSAALTIGNLEGPIVVDAECRDDLRYAYRVPPWTLDGLRWAGIDLVSLANNHLHDCGGDGVGETMRHLTDAGLIHFGAADQDRVAEPRIVHVGDTAVALCGVLAPDALFHDHGASLEDDAYDRVLAATRRRHAATPTRPGLLIAAHDDSWLNMVRHARERADVVIVFAHWGIRYHRPPSALQRQLAHKAIDAGADLVVGHHAHIWQPVELYRGKAVVYGLGNFAFGSRNRRATAGLIARAAIDDGRVVRVELFPLHTNNREVHYQSKLMRGPDAQQLLGELRSMSDAPLRIESAYAALDL